MLARTPTSAMSQSLEKRSPGRAQNPLESGPRFTFGAGGTFRPTAAQDFHFLPRAHRNELMDSVTDDIAGRLQLFRDLDVDARARLAPALRP